MTSKQFYFIFSIFIISLKIQKMPCILFNYLNKDSYIIFLLYLLIDFFCVIFAFFLAKKINKYKIDTLSNNNFLDILLKIGLIFTAIYFLFQCVLFYEAIQDLFAHILFENLSWKLFSLFLLGCVFYISSFDYDNIGRVGEIFFPIIMSSLVLLLVMGSLNVDFFTILPFQTIKNADLLSAFKNFNIWFGDFFLIIFLGSKSDKIKIKTTLITYVYSMLFATLFVITFIGRYQNLSALQPSVISVLSEQALLGIDIGRIDWFLILMAESGTVICSGLCLCIAKKSLSAAFKQVKENYFLIGLTTIVYFLDIDYLVDLNLKEEFFFKFSANFTLYIKLIIMIIMAIKIIYTSFDKNYNINNQNIKIKQFNNSNIKSKPKIQKNATKNYSNNKKVKYDSTN